ncbi:MAG: hypothetical protein GKR89_20055 [Candidatus Latescibacteria bacterium]|nr:hypothetical protein [Candidatus Latescibacterota bacterium]
MRIHRHTAFLLLLTVVAAHTQTEFQRHMPYRSFADSPFKDGHYLYFYLEDFEDGKLNTPGVTVNQGSLVIGDLGYKSPFVDSVDADDGQRDGSGLQGHSLWSKGNSSLIFVFNEQVLSKLPTHVGMVWTDAANAPMVSFTAFDRNGESIGRTKAENLGDKVKTGTAMEDCFFGVNYEEGIAKIIINNHLPDFEIDHLQYGLESPCRECNQETNILNAIPDR